MKEAEQKLIDIQREKRMACVRSVLYCMRRCMAGAFRFLDLQAGVGMVDLKLHGPQIGKKTKRRIVLIASSE